MLFRSLFALSKVHNLFYKSSSHIFSTVRLSCFLRCLQETAQLESESFVLRQQVTLTAELKAVLDSWVRYEQQIKESEQADLAKTVIEKVLNNIQDEKTQREILANAVAEVERESSCFLLLHTTLCWISSRPRFFLELVKAKAI